MAKLHPFLCNMVIMSLCYGRKGSTHTEAGSRVLEELKQVPPPDFPVTLPCISVSYFERGFYLLETEESKLIVI